MPPDSRQKRLKSADSKKDATFLQDDFYFRSYGDVAIHETMLGDRHRTSTYRNGILAASDQLKDKVVLDVGAGTGILSIFCIQAGARKVYAVEASSMIKQAEKIIADNFMSDKIELIQGVLEELELPEKVDAIVSEWMGYALLYETMLPSVLHARDKWLKPDGIMLPSEAALYMAPISREAEHAERNKFWSELSTHYGVNMDALARHQESHVSDVVEVYIVSPEAVQSHAFQLLRWDLRSIPEDVVKSVAKNYSCDCFGSADIHGFVLWFDVFFPKNVRLSTSPYGEETHWQHSVLKLPQAFHVEQGTEIKGALTITQNSSYNRYLDMTLTFGTKTLPAITHNYRMTDFY